MRSSLEFLIKIVDSELVSWFLWKGILFLNRPCSGLSTLELVTFSVV